MASITDKLNEKFGVAGTNIADAISQITGVYANDISEAIDAMTPGSGGGGGSDDSGSKPTYTDEAIMIEAQPFGLDDPSLWDGEGIGQYSTAEEYYESEAFESAYADYISGNLDEPGYVEASRVYKNLGYDAESLKKLMANSVFFLNNGPSVPTDHYKCFGIARTDNVCSTAVQLGLDKFIEFDLDGTGPAVWVALECNFVDTFTNVTDPETQYVSVYASVSPYGGWYKYLGYGSSLNKKTVLTTDNVIYFPDPNPEDDYDDNWYSFFLPVRLGYADGDYSVEDNAYQIAFSDHHEPIIFSFGMLHFEE